MRSAALAAILIASLFAITFSAAGKPVVLSHVSVRAYNAFGIDAQTLDRAQRIATDILGDAGVQTAWRHCRMASGPSLGASDGCADLLDEDDVVMRIVRTPVNFEGGSASFGYSLVSTDAHRGSLSTVFGDHITAAAGRVHLDRGVLLGRAMAHELGHLLLGTTDHSAAGLMRAVWPDAALVSRAPADWTFSPIDLARLRMALSFSNSSSDQSLR